MKVVLYPADNFGCGNFRMIWPGEALRAAGHDVTVVRTHERQMRVVVERDTVKDVITEADVVILQRVTHALMAQAVGVLHAKGVAVIVDVDDDLTSIHPDNAAWQHMHPANEGKRGPDGQPHRHSWRNLSAACRNATLVTVSTPALLPVYAAHGRGHVLHNYLPSMYYGLPRNDSDVVGWPASIHSHPDDPSAVGGAVARLVGDGAAFRMVGDSRGAGRAFGLREDPPGGAVGLLEWPRTVASIGVGIAPLSDTRFNKSKSWLKPMEMSALGVPWVASPRAEYARLHAMGAGVLAERPRVWYREMKRLRESAAMRQELSDAGRAVAEKLRLADHAWRWMEAWTRAYDLQHATTMRGHRVGV